MSLDQKDKYYSEKVWTRDDGQIDGYVFKGKRSFEPALNGLKSIMEKGKINEIENIEFKALDSQIRGAGLEIVVQLKANKTRGVAILKVYGPKDDAKKENSVTVTKSKESDSKYVVILAEKVVKPLMNGYLSGEIEIPENHQNTLKSVSKRMKNFKCNFCEKTCKSSAGLKGHITKKHLNFKQKENQNVTEPEKDGEVFRNKRKKEEINEVVESLLSNVINELENKDEDVTHEESQNEEKKYTKICNVCDFYVESNRNYISVQKILKHKDSCGLGVKCIQCDLKYKDHHKMKRHLRDTHGMLTSSTSPPLKKKKNKINNDSFTQEDIIDLSESIEEMEIDCDEKDIFNERSRMMDEKVIAKQKKNDEEIEKFISMKKKLSDNRKKPLEKISVKRAKQPKQENKPKTNKKCQKNLFNNLKEVPENCKSLVNEGDMIYVVPGDGACGANSAAAHLFQDEVYGPRLRKKINCFFAKHFYKKYQFKTACSPESPFRRQIKNEMIEFTDPEQLIEYLKTSDEAMYMWVDSEDLGVIADMFQIRIKIITTNGANDESPTVNWILPDEALAEDAEIKDVELEDMVLIHENDIHFNLVVGKNSVLATLGSLSYRNNIAPLIDISQRVEKEEDKEEKEDQKINEIEKKTLENQIEDLKVENTKLKQKLKQQEVQKHIKEQHSKEKITCDECDFQITTMLQLDAHKKSAHVTSKDDKSCSKECKERLQTIEKEYLKCETELRNITEENEKNKIEIKDLRKIIDLRQEVKKLEQKNDKEDVLFLNDLKNKGYGKSNPQSKSVPRSSIKKSDNNQMKLKCKKCNYMASGESHLKNHMKLIHSSNNDELNHEQNKSREEEFNCMKCAYQGNSHFQLQKHINLKHTNDENAVVTAEHIKCRICGEDFEEKANLMIHRKIKHKNFVARCKNYEERNCSYTSESCWWIHETKNSMSEGIQCYVCSKTFNTKAEMMRHRKKYHPNIVKLCEKFLHNRCPFQEDFCWFFHNQLKTDCKNKEKDIIEEMDTMENEKTSDFQLEMKKVKPPLNQMKTNTKN